MRQKAKRAHPYRNLVNTNFRGLRERENARSDVGNQG
jgi:hypothetical protein